MATSFQDTLSSLNALNNSIKVDGQVYGWFAHLVGQKSVETHLSKNEEINLLYRDLKQANINEKKLYLFLALFLLGIVLMGQYRFFIVALLVLPVWIYLNLKKKKCVRGICSHLLSQDYEKFAFAQKTLYQVCELYSQTYKTCSLVDAITFSNRANRSALIITFVVTCFIYPLDFGYVCLSMITVFFFVRIAIETDIVYKHIK